MKVRLSKHQSPHVPLRVSYLTNISAVILRYNDTFFILNFWLIFLTIDSWAVQLLSSGSFLRKIALMLKAITSLKCVCKCVYDTSWGCRSTNPGISKPSCRTVTPRKIGSTDRGASVPSIQRTEYLLRTNVARGLRLVKLIYKYILWKF